MGAGTLSFLENKAKPLLAPLPTAAKLALGGGLVVFAGLVEGLLRRRG